MKVLHLSSEATWRGGEQQIIYLVEETRKAGIDSVIACREGSKVEAYCQKNELPHFSLPYKSAYHLGTALGIKRLCRREKMDLIQTHSSKSHTLAVISGLLGNRTPQILTRRVDFPVKDNWPSRFKYNYRRIKKIICISDIIRKMMAESIRDQSKLTTIKSGVDLQKFSPFFQSDWLRKNYGLSQDCLLVGNTSAIADQKDYFTFVDVADRVRDQSGVHFFIIGDGPMRREVQAYVQKKNLADRITFTGFVDQITEVLPSLDIFLFTSKTEGLGTSILDAMAAHVPIVTTNAGGVGEMVQHEKSGLIFNVGAVDDLTGALRRLLSDSALRERMIQGAAERVKEFSKEKTAEKTIEVYRSVLTEPDK